MAITKNGNTIYIDATGTIPTNVIPVKIAFIIFTTDAANDQLILRDKDGSGALKIDIKHATANDTVRYNFSDNPITFPNAVHVDTLSPNAVATLVLRQEASRGK